MVIVKCFAYLTSIVAAESGVLYCPDTSVMIFIESAVSIHKISKVCGLCL